MIGIVRQKATTSNTLTTSAMDTFEPQVDTVFSAAITSYADLLARMPAIKYAGNPVINFTNAYTNIAPGGLVADPADATKFLLYVGRFVGNTRTNCIISAYRGSYSDPYTLTFVTDVLEKGASGFDNNGVSFGSALSVSGTIYLFYGAQTTGIVESVGVVTSTDGLTFTGRTQILSPDGTNETGFTDPTVIKEGATYYMYVTKKTGTIPATLPVGITIASSSSPTSGWTKTGTNALAIGSGTDPDAKYIEGAIVQKFGSDYCMLYTANGNTDIWSICLAHSTNPVAVFTKDGPVIEHSSTGWDSEGVAVPLLFNPSGNNWVCYYQGTTMNQPASVWGLGAVDLNTKIAYGSGYLAGKNGWSGDMTAFDISYPFINGTRSLRALKNTTTVAVTKTQDVTPSASSFFKATMMSPDASTSLLAGFYVMEGSTIVTGVYFDAGSIKDLRSGATWTTLQSYVAGTKYTIEIDLINNSTHTIKINGSTIATGVSNNNAIVTKADKIKIEKQTTSTSVVYFDDISCANQ